MVEGKNEWWKFVRCAFLLCLTYSQLIFPDKGMEDPRVNLPL